MIGDNEFKRIVNCENVNTSTGKNISEKAKKRGKVRRSIEKIRDAIEFKKKWGDD